MTMELYASPMACSLASHITALEADLPVSIRYVDTKAKKTDDGKDYLSIAPNGYVPALRLAGGQLLNEGPSVLQYLADQKPEKKLAPPWGTIERYQLIDTLNYLSTEVHSTSFIRCSRPARRMRPSKRTWPSSPLHSTTSPAVSGIASISWAQTSRSPTPICS